MLPAAQTDHQVDEEAPLPPRPTWNAIFPPRAIVDRGSREYTPIHL